MSDSGSSFSEHFWPDPENESRRCSSSETASPPRFNDFRREVDFKMIRKEIDVEVGSIFHPLLVNIVSYGCPSKEDTTCQSVAPSFEGTSSLRSTVTGYENLRVKIYYAAASLKAYLEVTFENKEYNCEPPDVEEAITSKFQYQFIKDLEEFKNELRAEADFIPPGEMIGEFELYKEKYGQSESKLLKYAVFAASNVTPNFPEFYARIETFTLWFIDGSNLIDEQDPRWKTFYIMEVLENEPAKHAFIGYCNVYEEHFESGKFGPRISQILILPPYQRQGICAHFLKHIQLYYAKNPMCRSITYEFPSDELIRVQWFVAASMCATLPSFNRRTMVNRWDLRLVDEAEKQMKFHDSVIRPAFEILRLKYITDDRPKMREFRSLIERRLTFSHKTPVRSLFTLKPNKEEISERIQLEAANLIKSYEKVVARMDEHPLQL